MRKLWACGLALGMTGLLGCSGATEDSKNAAPSATPSAVALAINGRVAVESSTDGTGPDVGKPCTVPADSKVKAGAEVRVTDSDGKVLGTDRLDTGFAFGSTLKSCEFSYSFKVPGASENYVLTVEGFPPMPYTREDIRRGLNFWEDQGTLVPR
ncbi:hypothetical protein [Streptomyces sp. NPDC094032]|uniref:hypothetical protein n=1 Tax=Streptomyces sp. NPDC094032 TaxID=3155308 RepID=UPI003332609D